MCLCVAWNASGDVQQTMRTYDGQGMVIRSKLPASGQIITEPERSNKQTIRRLPMQPDEQGSAQGAS